MAYIGVDFTCVAASVQMDKSFRRERSRLKQNQRGFFLTIYIIFVAVVVFFNMAFVHHLTSILTYCFLNKLFLAYVRTKPKKVLLLLLLIFHIHILFVFLCLCLPYNVFKSNVSLQR